MFRRIGAVVMVVVLCAASRAEAQAGVGSAVPIGHRANEAEDTAAVGVLEEAVRVDGSRMHETLSADQGERLKVLILFDDGSRDLQLLSAVRSAIEASAGRVRARIGLAGIVADIAVDGAASLAAMGGVYGVYDAALGAAPFDDAETVGAVAAWNFLLAPPPLSAVGDGDRPATDAYAAPDLPMDEAEFRAIVEEYESDRSQMSTGCPSNGAGFYDTSLYLAGDIAVGVFHTGAGWTPAMTTSSFAAVVASLDQFINMQPNTRIVFTYVNEVDAAGFPLSKPSNERLYDNDLRNAWCTDWAYLIEVRNNGTWPNAFIHGPSMRLDFGWFPYDQVARHETGHIFGAGDQYCNHGPNQRFGYLMATHANACGNDGTGYFGGAGEDLPDLMSGWDACLGYNSIVGPFTAGQLGWYNDDGDGILDVLETQPVIDDTSVTHTGGNAPTYEGIAFDRPLLNELSWPYGSVSINRITGVQYRINFLAWQEATAADLVFDSASERFLFQVPSLKNGTYRIDIRATNTIGSATVVPYSEQLVISGSPTTNTRPFGAISVTPARAMVGTTVFARGNGSRDMESGLTLLRYSWRWGDGSGWSAFSPFSFASHAYTLPGTYTVEMRVRDPQGLFHLVSQTVEATATDTFPVVAFSVTPENRHDTGGPTYTVAASVAGTSDAETSYALLETQWDMDGDGVYEIGWSTAKAQTALLSSLLLPLPPSCVPTPIYPRSDRRLVRVQVRDTFLNVSTAERVIWVVHYNHRPTVSAGNAVTYVPAPGGGFVATVHAADADQTLTWDGLLESRWDFESDGIWDTRFEPGNTMTVPSSATLSVEVQDRFRARVIVSPSPCVPPCQ